MLTNEQMQLHNEIADFLEQSLKAEKVGAYAEMDGRYAEVSCMAGGDYLMHDENGYIAQTDIAGVAAHFVVAGRKSNEIL